MEGESNSYLRICNQFLPSPLLPLEPLMSPLSPDSDSEVQYVVLFITIIINFGEYA